MNHPIDNQYRYGLCYDLNGQIVGFNLSPDVYIGLTDEEIERVLGAYAKRKHEQDEFLSTADKIRAEIEKLMKESEDKE